MENSTGYPLNPFNRSRTMNGLNDTDWEKLALETFLAGFDTHRQPMTIVLVSVYIPVFLFALAGNLLVLLVVLSNRSMRNITNFLLLNLALTDLLVTLVCLPLTVGELFYKFWYFGTFLCTATGYLQGVSISASVLTITALSLERYLVIRHPVAARRVFTTRRVKVAIVVIWMTACSIMIPLAVVRTLTHFTLPDNSTIALCHERWPNPMLGRFLFDVVIVVVIYIIPGSIVIYCYSSIGLRLLTKDTSLHREYSQVQQTCNRHSNNRVSSKTKHNQDHIMAGRRRVARMLLVLAVLFAVSWLPYHAVSLYMDFVNDNNDEAQISLISLSLALLLGHSHCAQNPIVYCLMNQAFKRGMAAILKCKRANLADLHQSEYSPGAGGAEMMSRGQTICRHDCVARTRSQQLQASSAASAAACTGTGCTTLTSNCNRYANNSMTSLSLVHSVERDCNNAVTSLSTVPSVGENYTRCSEVSAGRPSQDTAAVGKFYTSAGIIRISHTNV